MKRYPVTVAVVMGLLIAVSHAQSKALTLAYQLTHVDTGEPFPSPDGKRILFESMVAGQYQLFMMNVDGSTL